jgi:hypothetical protein
MMASGQPYSPARARGGARGADLSGWTRTKKVSKFTKTVKKNFLTPKLVHRVSVVSNIICCKKSKMVALYTMDRWASTSIVFGPRKIPPTQSMPALSMAS